MLGRPTARSIWPIFSATWRAADFSPGSKCLSVFTKSARPTVSTKPTHSSDDCTESDHDHHPHPDAHFDRRRRHRFAVLLPPIRRFVISAAINKYMYITIHRTFSTA